MDFVDFAMGRLAAMEDHGLLGNPTVWPDIQREYLCSPHLKQIERLNFMAFLIGNGVDPAEARAWVLYRGHMYDRDAIEHVNTLAAYLPAGKINTTYFDMILRKYVNLKTGEEQGSSNCIDLTADDITARLPFELRDTPPMHEWNPTRHENIDGMLGEMLQAEIARGGDPTESPFFNPEGDINSMETCLGHSDYEFDEAIRTLMSLSDSDFNEEMDM